MIQNAIAPKYDIEQPILRPAQEASEPLSENKESSSCLLRFHGIREAITKSLHFPNTAKCDLALTPYTDSSSTGSAFFVSLSSKEGTEDVVWPSPLHVTDCDSRFGN
ncbi:hypothetical protein BLNAU_16983 [Blattamonas nauphoetae]|uniref:Uncharacterized protein n=1 Tax=Blattamonas nauphoetae TaxID=2049346 RepID=A0ABQ9X9W7_9EUKA|nr:hypothetical protein BLNAU_16983 [Blattamonas nauphoetae]